MSFDETTVRHVAGLACLHFAPENEKKFAKQLDDIVRWIDQLKELDISHTEPLVSICEATQPMRKDEVHEGNQQEALLANAPESLHGFFSVPKVVE